MQTSPGGSPQEDAVIDGSLEEEDTLVTSGGSRRHVWQTERKPVVYISHVKVACRICAATCQAGDLIRSCTLH